MLARAPYRLSLGEIGRLTPYQVRRIYFGQRGKAASEPTSYRDIFFAVWRRRGLLETRIEEKWRQRMTEGSQ